MPQETWRGCHVLLEEGAHERGQPEGLTHSPQLWKVITIPNQYALPEYRHLSFGVLCIFRFSCKCRGAMNFWYISILKMLHLLTRCERITSNLCLFIRQARICNKFSNFSFVFIELDYSFLLSSSPGQWSRMCYIPQIGVEQNTEAGMLKYWNMLFHVIVTELLPAKKKNQSKSGHLAAFCIPWKIRLIIWPRRNQLATTIKISDVEKVIAPGEGNSSKCAKLTNCVPT